MNESVPSDGPSRAPLPDAWWGLPLRTRRVIAIGVVLTLAVALTLTFVFTGSDEPDPIEYVAALPADRVATWDQLAECESNTVWDADTGNGFFGGLQFTQASWEEVNGTGSPAEASREEQIMRAEFLFEIQGWGAWPSCSAQLELNGSAVPGGGHPGADPDDPFEYDGGRDPDGFLFGLHELLNPVGVPFVLEQLRRSSATSVLDVGRGGGFLSEAMVDEGFEVIGVDWSAEAISAATSRSTGDSR